jgi:hypothetical protein
MFKHDETTSLHLCSWRALLWQQEHNEWHHGLGDFNMTNKTNKQPYLRDR